MSEQYTPTTADIQASLVFLNIEHAIRNSDDPDTITIQKEVNAQFNRWLAEFERKASEKAWDELAEYVADVKDSAEGDYLKSQNPYRKEKKNGERTE